MIFGPAGSPCENAAVGAFRVGLPLDEARLAQSGAVEKRRGAKGVDLRQRERRPQRSGLLGFQPKTRLPDIRGARRASHRGTFRIDKP